MRFSDRIEEYTMDNGLKVILIEDNRSPVIVSSIWYRVGSSYEYSGVSGISHVLEHMMFQGTTNYPSSHELHKQIDKYGASFNAFTSLDMTCYHITIHPKNFLVLASK